MTTNYVRQKDLNIKVPAKVSIVGVGGTGSWTAIFSAMSGVRHLNLFDSDTVDDTNIARMVFKPDMIGRSKVDCLYEIIKGIRKECTVMPHENINEINIELLKGSDFVLCCTDGIDSQRLIYDFCKKFKIKFIRVGYDGLNFSMTSKVSKWGKGTGRYEVAPSWVIPTVIAAAIGVAQMTKFDKILTRPWSGTYNANVHPFPDEMSGNLLDMRFDKVSKLDEVVNHVESIE